MTDNDVWISDQVLSQLTSDVMESIPFETGGVLMGYLANSSNQMVVTNIIGCGPNAKRTECKFSPDYQFQEAEVARLYEESGRTIQYLGDWHSHPSGMPDLSHADRKTLSAIATHPDARISTPAMLIIGLLPKLNLAVYRGAMVRRFRLWRRVDILQVRLHTFVETGSSNMS